MNRLFLILKQRIIAVIFIILAVCGGIFVYWYIGNIEKEKDRDQYRDLIFIAAVDIEAGQDIKESAISEQKIDSAMYDTRYISEKDILLGKKATRDIGKGEIISREMIEGVDTDTSGEKKFSAYIPYGYRAVCIPVKFYGKDMLFRTGDRVDIISTFYNQEEGRVESRTILKEKEIIILASNGDASPEYEKQESNIFFDSGSDIGTISEGPGNMLLLTFYLEPVEAEEAFRALEEGMLNLVICPDSEVIQAGRNKG